LLLAQQSNGYVVVRIHHPPLKMMKYFKLFVKKLLKYISEEKKIDFHFKNKREYVEYKIQRGIKAEKYLENWLERMKIKRKIYEKK